MSDRKGLFGRILLLLLTVYALAMIVPDLLRVVHPLGSFGLAMDGDGRIYDVQGPFEAEHDLPAWRAGLRAGDRLDLAAMSCARVDTIVCASLLSQWGGVTYVTAGREATLVVASATEHSGREVKLTAEPRPMNRLLDAVVVLDTIAGVLVVLGAAWLVWTRPGLMTWGFFIYVIQFNPGQAFQFWAWLQLWPRALLAQNVIFLVMQAAAYTGLLMFALRAPVDRAEGRWRAIERALPALAIVFLGVALASMATIFGYPAEIWARAMLLIGFAVSVGALAILIGRRRDLSPRDYQRIRWVIWGCLIGLPAYLLAQLSQQTSLFGDLLGNGQAPEEVAGALSLVNGILCLFVVEAVRRKSVVNVWIPLRRATAFGLLLSVPVLFLHKQIEVIDDYIHMPDWAWVVVASGLVYLIARGHELATELMNRLFDRKFIRAERHLADGWRDHSEFRQLRGDRAPPGGRTDANAAPGVGGFVSRAGRLVHPKSQHRLGRGPRRCADQQPSPALRAVRPKALHPRFGRRCSHLPCRASGRPRAAGARRSRRQWASLLCARSLWRP